MPTVKISPAVFPHLNRWLAEAGTLDRAADRLHRELEAQTGPSYQLDDQQLPVLSAAVEVLHSKMEQRLPIRQLDGTPVTGSAKASLAFSVKSLRRRISEPDSGDRPAPVPGGQMWRCESCGQQVVTLIRVAQPPTCSNHTGGGRPMAAIDNRKQEK